MIRMDVSVLSGVEKTMGQFFDESKSSTGDVSNTGRKEWSWNMEKTSLRLLFSPRDVPAFETKTGGWVGGWVGCRIGMKVDAKE